MFIDNKGATGGLRSLTWYCQRGERRPRTFAEICTDSEPNHSRYKPLRLYVAPARGRLRFAKLSPTAIYSVEGLPFPLIKCILEACSADTLLRLEQASPVRPIPPLTAAISDGNPVGSIRNKG